jgi:hypothetical protein
LAAAVAAAAYGTVRVLFFDRGFIGLPPVGATPSEPEGGKLLVWFWGKFAGDPPGKSRVLVYGDGRLIVLRGARIPEGANPISSGFLEQRLTPDGVELLLKELLATGLFERDIHLLNNGSLEHGYWGDIRVRNGERLVHVDWEDPGGFPPPEGRLPAAPEQARALDRVYELLADPAAWLPASAWADREIKGYVASRYEVCVGRDGFASGGLASDVAALPPAARELFRARRWTRVERSQSSLRQTPPSAAPGDYCAAATTEEARAFAEALAELERDDRVGSHQLAYLVPRLRGVIWFEPYLPHGETICTPCG